METPCQVVVSPDSLSSQVPNGDRADSSSSRTEVQLIEAILGGKTDLYHDLVRPYEALIYRIAFMMLLNEAEAEDVTQKTFLEAYRKLEMFRFESKFSTWLIFILVHEARGHLHCREGESADPFESLSSQPTSSPFPAMCDEQKTVLDSEVFQI